jgi:hypothetical protein
MMTNIPEQSSFHEEEDEDKPRYRRPEKISDLRSAQVQSASVQNNSRSQISTKIIKKPASDVQEAHQG